MRIVTIWVSIFLTVGWVGLSHTKTFFRILTPIAHADVIQEKAADRSAAYEAFMDRCKKAGNSEQSCDRKWLTSQGAQPPADKCDEAQKEYRDKASQFSKSCNAGKEECLDRALTCANCSGTDAPSWCPGREDVKKYKSRQKTSATQGLNVEDESANVRAIAACPSVGAGQLKELKEKVKDHREKIGEIEEDLMAAQQELREAKEKFQNNVEEANTKLEEETEKIMEDTKVELKDKRKEYDDLNSQILQMTNKIQEVTNTKVEGIRAAERECYNFGLSELNRFLTERRNSINKSQLSAGGMNNLLSGTGPSRRQKDSDYANKYYNSCLRGKNHTDKIKAINEAFAFAMKQIQDSIQAARQQQLKLIEEISGKEVREKFEKAIAKAQSTHNKTLMRAQREYETKATGLTQKIEKLQKDLALEKSEQVNTEATYSIAKRVSGGSDANDEGAKFVGYFDDYRRAADEFFTSCPCRDDDKYPGCKEAKAVMCADKTEAIDEYCSQDEIDKRIQRLEEKNRKRRKTK